MSFETFMQAQCEEMEAAIARGDVADPFEWIEKHAEEFRNAHEVDA